MTWKDHIEAGVRTAVTKGQSPIEIKAFVDAVWEQVGKETAAKVYGKDAATMLEP